jgi:hypothetical protein
LWIRSGVIGENPICDDGTAVVKLKCDKVIPGVRTGIHPVE